MGFSSVIKSLIQRPPPDQRDFTVTILHQNHEICCLRICPPEVTLAKFSIGTRETVLVIDTKNDEQITLSEIVSGKILFKRSVPATRSRRDTFQEHDLMMLIEV